MRAVLQRSLAWMGLIAGLLSVCGDVIAGESLAKADADGMIRVPADYPTIQAALDAAENGDTVVVSPGVYHESLVLEGKNVTLASEFFTTGNRARIAETILDGIVNSEGGEEVLDHVILVKSTIGPASKIVGFTIRNGDDGILCSGSLAIVNNRFEGNEDAIDYEGGGGLCRDNVFENNRDDAVDCDHSTAAEVTNNIIRDNDDDGIEIRLHNHQGARLQIVICDNLITGNGEDGIQIINYPRVTNRRILIERNLIAYNAMAGIGCMANGITKENYDGAGILEPVLVVNNTIADNEYGIVGGHNLAAFNNVLLGHRQAAMKNVRGHSVAGNNLFWNNATNALDCNINPEELSNIDPVLDKEYRPQAASPCIDAGQEELEAQWGSYHLDPGMIAGEAPDLGAFEFRGDDQLSAD
jgi:hypothetical protein